MSTPPILTADMLTDTIPVTVPWKGTGTFRGLVVAERTRHGQRQVKVRIWLPWQSTYKWMTPEEVIWP